MTNTKQAEEQAIWKCCKCGYQMIKDEVWVSEDLKNASAYCYCHAPDSAIRLRDTTQAEPVS